MMNSPAPWIDAVIESVRDVTPTVREFLLRPGAGAAVYAPGAHLEVQLSVHGGLQTRSYSLVGAPDGHRYRIAVKCLPQGRGGSLAMWSLAPGDTLPLRGPRNSFPLALDAPQYLLVGGGIGVTPMVFMAQTLAARGAQVRMLLAARGSEELAYADTLRTALGNSLHTFADDQGKRPDFAREVATLLPGALLLCCGPAGLLAAVRRAWAGAQRPAANLRFENFGSSAGRAAQAFGVHIPRHGMDLTVPADCSLLDAVERAGVQVLSNCRRGECGLCAMDVVALEGEIDHRDVFLSAQEKQANQRICVCVSRVMGRITLDSAYRKDTLGVPSQAGVIAMRDR